MHGVSSFVISRSGICGYLTISIYIYLLGRRRPTAGAGARKRKHKTPGAGALWTAARAQCHYGVVYYTVYQ